MIEPNNQGGMSRAVLFLTLLVCCMSCKLIGGKRADDGEFRTTLPMLSSRMVVTEAEYEKYRYGDLFEPTKIQFGQRKVHARTYGAGRGAAGRQDRQRRPGILLQRIIVRIRMV